MSDTAHLAAVGRVVPLTRVRRLIADRLRESVTTKPHVTLQSKLDADGLLVLRARLAPVIEAEGGRLSLTGLLASVVARVLLDQRNLNGHLVDGELHLFDRVDLGIAVALDDGLVAPVIRAVEQKSLLEIATDLTDLTNRARAGALKLHDIEAPTFTLSNLGTHNVDAFNPLIAPPQLATLGVGRLVDELVPTDEGAAVRQRITFCLSFDHAAVDGATAARFMDGLADTLDRGREHERDQEWLQPARVA